MAKSLKIILVLLVLLFGFGSESKAASQAECAIWLCLPGGFPTGCSDAYSAFKTRIKKGRPPLPDLSSCTTGPDGKTSNGQYQMGYEYFEPCKEGYILRQTNYGIVASGVCERKSCKNFWRENCYNRDSYEAIRRPKPSYVKMWVDGQYLGQFFY
jgi:hypothetical protein